MSYIHDEVRAVCRSKRWGSQVRRRWSTREKAVSACAVEDYEWKLLPHGNSELHETPPREFDEGVYFVLRFDAPREKFVFQHDTSHCGMAGDHWLISTYSEIELPARDLRALQDLADPPGPGWLREILKDLVARFGPNQFSIT